jgi:hypothetical protein
VRVGCGSVGERTRLRSESMRHGCASVVPHTQMPRATASAYTLAAARSPSMQWSRLAHEARSCHTRRSASPMLRERALERERGSKWPRGSRAQNSTQCRVRILLQRSGSVVGAKVQQKRLVKMHHYAHALFVRYSKCRPTTLCKGLRARQCPPRSIESGCDKFGSRAAFLARAQRGERRLCGQFRERVQAGRIGVGDG